MTVSLSQLKFYPKQRIRQNYPNDYLEKLLDSMNKLGQIYDILIDEHWEVHVGGGRYLAAKKGKWEKVHVDMRKGLTDDDWFLLELHENIIRKNLDAVEEAIALTKGKEIYERLYPETKQYFIGGISRVQKSLVSAADKLTTAQDHIENGEIKESYTKLKAKESGESERTIRRKIELGKAIQERKIDTETVKALRLKRVSRSKVMRQVKNKDKAPSSPQNLVCSGCEKGVPLFCPNCKATIIWCQRYKNPFLRRECDSICEEFGPR